MPAPLHLKNKRFGRLKVIERCGKNKYGAVRWLCICDCGKRTEVYAGNLTRGHVRSCGCLQKEKASDMRVMKLVGKRFGRLVVEKLIRKTPKTYWLCVCDCGNRKVVRGTHLTSGNTNSCGCLRREKVSVRGKEHPGWRGGITSLYDDLRNLINKKNRWNERIIKLYGPFCYRCGSKDKQLNAHHIIPLKLIVEHFGITSLEDAASCVFLDDLENGVPLCVECHKWVHSSENKNKEFIRGEVNYE